jgi:DNA polymerase II large subunit
LVLSGRLKPLDGHSVLVAINKFSKIKLRDKAGTFIGARMGRPEKAKMRKMQPPPHVLFPLGEEGGRLRTFQSALEGDGFITADFEYWWDEKNSQESIFPINYKTGEKCVLKYWDKKNKMTLDASTVAAKDDAEKKWLKPCKQMKYDFKSEFNWCLSRMKTKVYPDLIKGVLGTVSENHSPEHIMKGILRAKHDVFVNKDGTIRYDASEVPITHFKPKEVGTSVERLRELGYTHDMLGNPLTNDDQVLEMVPQDVILPASKESPNEACDDVFFRVANFIDDELNYLYDMESYYKLKTPADLAGHYVIVLAPHTSAGSLGRIIGFSKTQGLFAHPLMHAAIRRDCDGDEGGIFLLLDAFLNFSTKYLNTKLGATMDAPLVLTSILNPSEVDDMVFNMDRVSKYGLDFYDAAMTGKKPWDVKVELVKNVLGTVGQYEGYKFTHETDDFNSGVKCSAYKLLPSMKEKLDGQMKLAEKIRAVDASDVAKIVIEKHFIKDTMGNLRKFSQQEFRCTACGAKYRRPPLSGRCNTCGKANIIFTVTEGSIKKYVGYSKELADKYKLPDYLKEVLELNEEYIDSIFGKETEKQEGLSSFF